MLSFESLCKDLTHLFVLAEERSEAAFACSAAADAIHRLGHNVSKGDKLSGDPVVFIHEVDVLFCLDKLRHEPEADVPVGVVVLDFLRFRVPVESSLLVLRHEVLVKVRKVAFLVVDWLQANILSEPDEAFHDSCGLTQLLSALPTALAKPSFHILAMDQVLVDLNEQFTSLQQLLYQVAMLFVLCISDRAFLELRDSDSLLVVHVAQVGLPGDELIRVLHVSHDDLGRAQEKPDHLLRQTAVKKTV